MTSFHFSLRFYDALSSASLVLCSLCNRGSKSPLIACHIRRLTVSSCLFSCFLCSYFSQNPASAKCFKSHSQYMCGRFIIHSVAPRNIFQKFHMNKSKKVTLFYISAELKLMSFKIFSTKLSLKILFFRQNTFFHAR